MGVLDLNAGRAEDQLRAGAAHWMHTCVSSCAEFFQGTARAGWAIETETCGGKSNGKPDTPGSLAPEKVVVTTTTHLGQRETIQRTCKNGEIGSEMSKGSAEMDESLWTSRSWDA